MTGYKYLDTMTIELTFMVGLVITINQKLCMLKELGFSIQAIIVKTTGIVINDYIRS